MTTFMYSKAAQYHSSKLKLSKIESFVFRVFFRPFFPVGYSFRFRMSSVRYCACDYPFCFLPHGPPLSRPIKGRCVESIEAEMIALSKFKGPPAVKPFGVSGWAFDDWLC